MDEGTTSWVMSSVSQLAFFLRYYGQLVPFCHHLTINWFYSIKNRGCTSILPVGRTCLSTLFIGAVFGERLVFPGFMLGCPRLGNLIESSYANARCCCATVD